MIGALILSFVLLYFAVMIAWILWHLLNDTATRMLAHDQNKLRGKNATLSETQDKGEFTITHTMEDGIEQIHYSPKHPRHKTPILMAHGMWHGARCWQAWQEILAEHGWESISYSLPGHGKSLLQRSLTRCTLAYYLAFVRDEINRLPRKPILMGHSMGGALSQWALKYVCDDLPAVILVAPWVSHAVLSDAPYRIIILDPIGIAMMYVTWNANSWIRTPEIAAKKLITSGAILTPDELRKQLTGESALVIFQHNPPFWSPAEKTTVPMLVLAGEKDAVVTVDGLRKSAAHYKADFLSVPEAGHNIMMEKSYRETVLAIDDWLNKKQIT